MGIWGFLKTQDIHQGLEEYDVTPDALLVDVRTPGEYSQGHIPGSCNIPLQSIDKVADYADNKNIPLFVYCLSGARSQRAVGALKQMGYTRVKNLGGISGYRGKVEQ
ncbi:MAG: rhodanese-like domain-containing protein [Clostridia bacterium]|nr:rhodanese-like domain-containing protein [Clostridia bacterium]